MTPERQRERAPEAPEHHNDRRAFLVWALMLGAIPPERVTERVLEELAQTIEGDAP
jgi:hypothetical protein